MIGIWQDLRHTVRTLVGSPGFSAVILGILILGIGINAAIFSIANAVLLKPLPYIQNPDQLVDVFTGVPENPYSTVSYLDYLDYRNQTNVLSDVISDQITQLNLSGGGPTESISGEVVSGNYFSVLGVKSELGRVLLPGDDQAPGTNPVAVIGYTLWQRDFGSDQNVIGRQITLNDHSFTVIGVTPQGFFGKDLGYLREIWIPLSMSEQVTPGVPWLSERGIKWLSVQGRLKPGMSINQARANMATVVSQLAQAYPTTNEGRIVSVAPLNKMGISPDGQKLFRGTVMLAMVIVGLILLIACANVGGLLLARGAERRKEIAIRLAIGASRGRLVQQLLTESIVLALVGGGLGVLIARWSTTLLIAFDLPYINSRTVDAGVDWRVLGFTLLISILSGVFFGLLPALQTTRPNLVSALKESLPTGRTDRLDLRKLLVIFQIAVSLVLLIVAGLFVKSLRLSQAINPGFETNHVMFMPLDLPPGRYPPREGSSLYRQLTERIGSLPGVQAVSLAGIIPLSGSHAQGGVVIEGYEPPLGAKSINLNLNIVSPNYFDTLRIPILKGRDFSIHDNTDATRVAIINEAMAQRFWPNQEPIGKQFKSVSGEQYQIIGLVKDSNQDSLWAQSPVYYLSFLQRSNLSMKLLWRTANDPQNLLKAVQHEIQELDRDLPVSQSKTIQQEIGRALEPQRTAASISSAFGLLALVLAILGLYGVMAYSVTRRRREIGIRLALGGQRNNIVTLVVKQGMVLVLVGVAIGLVGSLIVTRFISHLLYGVDANDPMIFVGSVTLLLVVAICANLVPACRAAKVDPMSALRYE